MVAAEIHFVVSKEKERVSLCVTRDSVGMVGWFCFLICVEGEEWRGKWRGEDQKDFCVAGRD